jgi:uncharacterized protein (TIGR03086 family)
LLSIATLIDRLEPEALSAPTPCAEWRVIDVIDHLAAVTEKFGRFAAGERDIVRQRHDRLIGSAPAREFRSIIEAALNEWERHPEALHGVCLLPFGSFDGRSAAAINVFDAVVHQWDIAVGASVAHDIDEHLAVVALGGAALFVNDAARAAGHFTAPHNVPADASAATRLLAIAGRQ